MAHTKAQGAANRLVNMTGKRLGLKRASGQFVNAGTIILRQRGSRFYPGTNTSMGKDFTIFATKEGYVSFRNMTGNHRGQKYIDVLDVIKTKKADPKNKTTPKTMPTKKKATTKKTPAKKTATKATKK